MRKYVIPIAGLTMAAVVFSGCGSGNVSKSQDKKVKEEVTTSSDSGKSERDIFAMDTYMTVTAYGDNSEDAVDKAEKRIEELDSLLSTGDEGSEVYALNQSGHGKLSEDGMYLLKKSLEINKSTDGAFNPAIYPIMELWGFTDQNYKVPDEAQIKEKLKLTDVLQIKYDESTGQVDLETDGMKIDFGGIAKGYTSSQIMKIFEENGIESGMVSLGGNVQVLGGKPDGSSWRVAVQNPNEEENYLGILEIKDKAVITSGGYERYFEENGKTYHHIIDAANGYPADSGLTSVTIICSDGTLADGLSTSLFIMGLDKAAEYWDAHRDEFDMILYTKDGGLYITEGIEEDFTSDYQVKTIK